jgi:GMP synthase (glutamine-hydrolysing)
MIDPAYDGRMVSSVPGRSKRVLLVDAVPWTSDYPEAHPLRNVFAWFHRHLDSEPGLLIRRLAVDDVVREGRVPKGTDGVILSGSPRDAWAEDEFTKRLLGALRSIADAGTPFLGVCYGHQVLARLFGGDVRPNPIGLQLGTLPVRLTDAGKSSPLFQGMNETFSVMESHRDAVLELPADTTLLASNEKTPIQAFSRGNMFGVQFHPEMNPETLRFLWEPRKSKYPPGTIDPLLEALSPTPEAPQILKNFVRYCV